MPVQLVPGTAQLQALALLRDLGADKIGTIFSVLSQLEPPPLRPSDIRQALTNRLPDLLVGEISAIVSQLLSLYTLKRQRGLTNDELLEGLLYGFREAQWSEEQILQWKSLEPQVRQLLSLPSVVTVVKSLDLSFDYVNLLQNVKIITDIRPIFNDDGSVIEGAIVSYTLRLYYDSISGSASLSIALDQRDVENMLRGCERALKKAKTAREFMQDSGVQRTLICGGEE